MGSENDIESFIQLQKRKLAQERNLLQQNETNLEPPVAQRERKQWDPPSKVEPNTNKQKTKQDEEDLFSKLGQYEARRKALENERHNEYNKIVAQNQNRQKAAGNTSENGGMFSNLGQYESRRKILDEERKNEYNKRINDVSLRTTGKEYSFNNSTLPGLRDHPSAEHSKIKQRNAEYNQFLKAQEDRLKHRYDDRKGFPSQAPLSDNAKPAQSDANQRRRPHVNEQTTPRQRNLQSYEELLEEKRRQEYQYRSKNDPDAKRSYVPPPNASNPPNNQKRFDDLDQAYERRKVKFSNDKAVLEDTVDIYRWLHKVKQKFGVSELPSPKKDFKDQGRSRSFYQDPLSDVTNAEERSRSVPPKESAVTGLAIGRVDTPNTVRRRKEQYRRELESQMKTEARNRSNQRLAFASENEYPAVNQPRTRQQPPQSNAYPQYQQQKDNKPGFGNQSSSLLDDRRPLVSILNERRDLIDTSPNANVIAGGYKPGVLESGFTGLYEPSALSGLSQPLIGYNPSITNYQTPADVAYNYYGAQDPLVGYSRPPFNPLQSDFTQQQQTPRTQLPINTSVAANNQRQAAVGAFPSEEKNTIEQKKSSQLAYQNELKRQMEEKQRALAAKKAEQEAYDRKLQAEIDNYNPFGRGGGGAPMKDVSGKVVADLRTLNLSNKGLSPRFESQAQPQNVSTTPRYDAYAAQQLSSSLTNDDKPSQGGYARGGNGIFGEPKTEVQKTATDRYKEELKLQIEEKRRAADAERQKLKAEEEREMKRLEEDRLKIQKEYEEEQAKAKAKEEETRRKNEELKLAAEAKRKLEEDQRAEAEKKKKEREEEQRKRREQQEKEDEQRQLSDRKPVEVRSDSPPIPTLRSKTQPPGSMDLRPESPPVPAQRSRTEHDNISIDSKPVIPEAPVVNEAPQPIAVAASRPSSRVKSAEVLNQLAHMRQQLQQERQRVESALNQQKINVDDDNKSTRRNSRELDIFETARSKKPVSARRNKGDVDGGPKRLGLSHHFSSPPDFAPSRTRTLSFLERQSVPSMAQMLLHRTKSSSLLRNKQSSAFALSSTKNERERSMSSTSAFLLEPVNPTTPTSLLDSDSAFIDNNGMRAAFPDDFDTLATNQNARRRRREKIRPSYQDDNAFSNVMREYLRTPESPSEMLEHYRHQNDAKQTKKVLFKDERDHPRRSLQKDAESVASIDPDRITRKNQDRLRKLRTIAGDDISVDDPDDIIDRFMTKQNHRPPSGQTLTDESWMNTNN